MSERKFLVNRFRIGLVGLVVVALSGLTAGGALAATGRGTAAASITLLDVALGNVQSIKVLSDEGQGTLDFARLGLAGNRAYGQLTAVNASGLVPLTLPDPPRRAEAPGTNSASLDPVPVSFPQSSVQVASTGRSIGPGLLANGTLNPLKLEAFLDAAGARSTVGTEIPSLQVLQGLISVNNVKVGSVSTSATTGNSKGDSGVVSIDDITVLDLDQFLAGLSAPLSGLNIGTLTGLVDALGLAVSSGTLTGLSGTDVKNQVNGALAAIDTLVPQVTVSCTDPAAVSSALSAVTSTLQGLGLPVPGGVSCAELQTALNTTIANLRGSVDSLIDGVFSVLEGAPLLQVSGIELSALANATETLAGSSASTSAKFGTVKVGNSTVGALDLNSTVEQINALKSDLESKLSSVTSVLGPQFGNIISLGVMERSASTRAEGLYNVADAAIKALRVTITPPDDLAGALAAARSLPVSGVLSQVGAAIPVNTGLADGVLAQALGLSSVLSQPTTIVLGAVRAQGDFTTNPSGGGVPTSPPVSGELPRTGGSNGAWVAALAALALAGAFGLTRTLRKAPVGG